MQGISKPKKNYTLYTWLNLWQWCCEKLENYCYYQGNNNWHHIWSLVIKLIEKDKGKQLIVRLILRNNQLVENRIRVDYLPKAWIGCSLRRNLQFKITQEKYIEAHQTKTQVFFWLCQLLLGLLIPKWNCWKAILQFSWYFFILTSYWVK